MQEPIQPGRGEFQTYQQQMNPTDWVMTNIGGYIKAKSSSQVLEQINRYARYLQHQKQLERTAHQQSLLAQGKPVEIPTHGTPEQIANTATYNVLQSSVHTQITSLQELLALLIKDDPKLGTELKKFFQQLEEMARSFPTLSEEHLQTLTNIMQICEKLYPNMSSKDLAKEYGKKELKMLEKLYNTFQEASDECEESIKGLQAKIHPLLTSQQMLAQLSEILQMISNKNGKLSGKDLQQISAIVQTLLKNKSKLSPSARKKLEALLGQLRGMGDVSGMTLGQILDDYEREARRAEYEHRDLEETIIEIDPATVTKTHKNTKALLSHVEDEGHDLQSQSTGLGMCHTTLSEAHDMVGKSAPPKVTKSISNGTLPDDFKNAILNHYMKQQEAYLEALAFVLYFDNMGAEIGNQLLEDTLGFQQGNVNFNFAGSLHHTGKASNTYSGSASQAEKQLSEEKHAVSKALNQIQNALNSIHKELKSIEDNKSLSASQKAKLEKQLKISQSDLLDSQHSLKILGEELANIKIIPGKGTKANTQYSIILKSTGKAPPPVWAKALGNQEQTVIAQLSATHSYISTNQSNFSDQGQNQQMILQMRMTEIQQEWTVVSTCLQMLNQMYMTCAQGITQ